MNRKERRKSAKIRRDIPDLPRREENHAEVDLSSFGDDDSTDLHANANTPDQIRQMLARHGHLDEDAPWDAFLNLVVGAAVSASGRRMGVLIKAGADIDERLTLPETVLGNLKIFKSWLNENGFPALVDVSTDSSLSFLAGQVFTAARELHIVLEREGLTRVKGSGALIGCYAGQLFAPNGLVEKLAAPRTFSQSAGTVDSWNEAVGPYLLRAPVLLFSVGLALTPAMFGLTEECLAFELVGPPGALDERIVAQVAASVGERGEAPYPWPNVKSALARVQETGRCRMLALDDIGQDDRRHIAETCGQQQFEMGAAGDRCAAAAVLVVGTSWKTVGSRLNRPSWRSSHELGLPGIPTPRVGSLSKFSDDTADVEARAALTSEVESHYGCLLPELLRNIVREQDGIADQFEQLHRQTLECLTTCDAQPLTGIERRVAAKFASVGATLEIAIRQGVLKLASECGTQCAGVLFGKWLRNWRFRDGNIHRAAAQCVQEALRRVASDLPTFEDDCKSPPLGFRGKHDQEDLLWISPDNFKALCGDFERAICVEALDDYNVLKKAGKGLQLRKRLPTALVNSMGGTNCEPVVSFYAIRASFLETALG